MNSTLKRKINTMKRYATPQLMTMISILLLLTMTTVSAQRDNGNNRGATLNSAPPSVSGGSPGGPGGNGAAVNAGFSAPSPDVSAPSIDRPDANNRDTSGLDTNNRDTSRTDGTGGFRDADAQQDLNDRRDGLNLDTSGGRDTSVLADAFGSGWNGFNNRENDGFSLNTLFGERGTGEIVLPFGGDIENNIFANIRDPRTNADANDLLVRLESGENFNFEGFEDGEDIPAVPSPYDDLNASVENYQQQINQNIQNQSEQIDSTIENAGQTVDNASDTLSATYNQLWTDYYEAVDYTADAYYNTVTSSVDYAATAYNDALQLTTDTIDYYIDYAEAYADYCVIYPWDCYSYAYDEVTADYVYIGDVSSTPVTTITIEEINVNGVYALSTLAQPSAEAYKSLVRFANDQMGAVVEPLYAGELTTEVLAQIDPLPDEIVDLLLGVTQASGAAYYGLLEGGVGSVVVGDCANEGICELDDALLDTNLTTDATGLFGFNINAPMPTNTNAALVQLFQVFPKLEGLTFAQITNIDGYHFTAVTAGLGINEAGNSVSVPKAILTGIVNIEGRTVAYALVAVGDAFVELILEAI
jgi:hypothetical protein